MTTLFKRWFTLCILLTALCAFFYFDLGQYFSFDALKAHRESLITWTHQHYFYAVSLFMLVYILAVAISFPGATFLTLVSGFFFGIILGTLYAVISATIGALIVFLAVRIAFEPWIAKRASTWVNKMRAGFQHGAFRYLLVLRLIPLFPFWAVNIVPALLGVETSTFIITTFLGIIPGTFIYVLIGNGLGYLFDQNKTPDLHIIFAPQILLPLIALAFLCVLPAILKFVKRKFI